MSETTILQQVRLALSHGERRLFRNNSGEAWLGRPTRLGPTSVRLDGARKVRLGLGIEGSSDLIGWTGPRFTALEIKADGRLTDAQERWLRAVHAAGGLAGVARDVDRVVWL